MVISCYFILGLLMIFIFPMGNPLLRESIGFFFGGGRGVPEANPNHSRNPTYQFLGSA